MKPTRPYDPRNHPAECTYHVDQYPHECTCGLLGANLRKEERMPIEIIKRGTPPGEVRIITTCRTCSTEFSFLPNDATRQPDMRNGAYYAISCPVCGKECTVDERLANPPRRG